MMRATNGRVWMMFRRRTVTGEFGEFGEEWQLCLKGKEREIKGKKIVNNKHGK